MQRNIPSILPAIIGVLACIQQINCAPNAFLTPHPPGGQSSASAAPAKQPDREQPPAAESASSEQSPAPATGPSSSAPADSVAAAQTRSPQSQSTPADSQKTIAPATFAWSGATALFAVPTQTVRVALLRGLASVSLYSSGTMIVGCEGKGNGFSFKGPLQLTLKRGASTLQGFISQMESREISMPCTLKAVADDNIIEVGDKSYRGNLIIAAEENNSFSVINRLPMEEYLCGAISLEIGKLPEKELEAVKAQAVAARSYAYKKITNKAAGLFDVVATTDDQVYGGVNAECAVCTRAVRETKDLVLVFGDSLISAYYHSTCGGRTANIEDVWDKPAAPYLKGADDYDRNGKAYCSSSRFFAWQESWSAPELSAIMREYSKPAFPATPLTGEINGVRVFSRYSCGRIQFCDFATTTGKFTYGTDKIRFAMRRNTRERDVLRSANFTVISADTRNVKITGKGYGHGVGMCQMGAVGRAREGQKYRDILAVYYAGTEIKQAKVDEAPH
jgi:stage II sporulation protein D